MREELGVGESGLDRVVRGAFGLLDLIAFFTAGEDKPAQCWHLRRGLTAWHAAGEIHSDIQRGFVRAEVIGWDALVDAGGYAGARDRGTLRLEGRDYAMADGDVHHRQVHAVDAGIRGMAATSPHLVLVAESADDGRAPSCCAARRARAPGGRRGRRRAGARTGGRGAAGRRAARPASWPRVGGMTVLDRLRADDELAAVPVIMLTDSSDPELLVEALRRGAHDYLRAPFDPEELDARVTAALRVKRLHDALLEANQRLALQALTDELTQAREPPPRRARARARDRARASATADLLALDARRRRPLQDDQRHARPPGGRRGADRGRAPARRRGCAAATSWPAGAATSSSRSCPTPTRPAPCARQSGCAPPSRRTPMEVAGATRDVTVSVGWAHWSGDTPDDLLARADKALYAAKDAGRNTICRRTRPSRPAAARPGGPCRARSRRGGAAGAVGRAVRAGAPPRRRAASRCP